MIALLAAAGGEPVIPDFGGSGTSCVRENGTFCVDWFRDNWSGIFVPAVGQHIKLVVIAIVVGFALATALTWIAYRFHWTEKPITIITGILYTIPSLALFQLLVPVTHLSLLTAEIALVSYTLLILFRNMLEGLRGVPADVRDAARGMGLTDRQILWRVEVPLALPAVFAGLRIATVTIISLATVAAFVINEGLGKPIFDAIQSNTFKTEIFAAGGLAVALALLADGALVLTQRALTPWARTRTR
jgi:osmoprotectant transport system permease protein